MTEKKKKTSFSQREELASEGSVSSIGFSDARIDAFTETEQKKIIRRVDYRLIVILGLMYAVNLMDRANLGIALIAGMDTDLKLVGNRYQIITIVFYVTYNVFQPPATVWVRKLGPRFFLTLITSLWALTMLCFAFVKQWWQLIPLRILLGVFEAGLFPGCAYLISCWYPRYDVQKRFAGFSLIGHLMTGFAPILAYGFYRMNGLGDLGSDYGQHYRPTKANPKAPSGIMGGIAGWRWIFIMESLITMIVCFAAVFLLVDFPEREGKVRRPLSVPFLSEKEAAFMVAKVEQDRHDAIPEPFNLKKYILCGLDLKIWVFALLFMCTALVLAAIAAFLPIILHDGMGFGIALSQILVAPPYVTGALWTFVCAIYGDKYHRRGPFIIFNAGLALVGLSLLGFAHNNGVRYFGVVMANTGCGSNVACILTYQANNIRGQWKRALASATMIGSGGLGSIIGVLVFRPQDAPGYRPGIYTALTASGIVILAVMLLDWKFTRANKRAACGGKLIAGLEGFRYTL